MIEQDKVTDDNFCPNCGGNGFTDIMGYNSCTPCDGSGIKDYRSNKNNDDLSQLTEQLLSAIVYHRLSYNRVCIVKKQV